MATEYEDTVKLANAILDRPDLVGVLAAEQALRGARPGREG